MVEGTNLMQIQPTRVTLENGLCMGITAGALCSLISNVSIGAVQCGTDVSGTLME